jgi:hypothetical protein
MPFKPGQSGNPNGRPKKGGTLTDLIASKINRDDLAQMIIDMAVKEKNFEAMKLIWAYFDGKPVDRKEVTGEDGNALRIQVVYADRPIDPYQTT